MLINSAVLRLELGYSLDTIDSTFMIKKFKYLVETQVKFTVSNAHNAKKRGDGNRNLEKLELFFFWKNEFLFKKLCP